jgi:hypothetical protein
MDPMDYFSFNRANFALPLGNSIHDFAVNDWDLSTAIFADFRYTFAEKFTKNIKKGGVWH